MLAVINTAANILCVFPIKIKKSKKNRTKLNSPTKMYCVKILLYSITIISSMYITFTLPFQKIPLLNEGLELIDYLYFAGMIAFGLNSIYCQIMSFYYRKKFRKICERLMLHDGKSAPLDLRVKYYFEFFYIVLTLLVSIYLQARTQDSLSEFTFYILTELVVLLSTIVFTNFVLILTSNLQLLRQELVQNDVEAIFKSYQELEELARLTNEIFGIQNLTTCGKNYIWLIYNFFYIYLDIKTTSIWSMLFFEFLWLMRFLVPMISLCWWCEDFKIEAKLFRLDLVNAMVVRNEQTVSSFWFFKNIYFNSFSVLQYGDQVVGVK
jgi:hypothetical protein